MPVLIMDPQPGERVLRFVGDRLVLRLRTPDGHPLPEDWRVRLRTNFGRAPIVREEIIYAHTGRLMLAHGAWHDIPMHWRQDAYERELTLAQVGYFRAKAYAIDPGGDQHWPDGADVGVSVHPDAYRTGNTIYCAFVRLFGPTRATVRTRPTERDELLVKLDKEGYTVIPPSGKLRDLIQHLPHILDTLGCRILHLLPITPTPTTYAKFGRFGSPYAVQDLTAIDPALVVFDQRTTGVDQFRELTYATHLRGGRVFLDVVPNHTGWGATLQEQHPEWYVRNERGEFVSPGAWGVTWEDLAELDHRNPQLWECMADAFLTWCWRGVDGFRCDAGYKIPLPAWQYITARVLEEFPETIFLLEGLGGSWEATEALLTEGGMQWAYSELFQNYTGREVANYLDYSIRQSKRVGLYVHYSETHDNLRLAEKGRAWSLLRNQLCALASPNGAFGFTCGVEWLAREKVNVHASHGLAWGATENLVPALARLNRLLADHPCFLDGATLRRLSEPASPVLALARVSADQLDHVLVLVNTEVDTPQTLRLTAAQFHELGQPRFDLLGHASFETERNPPPSHEIRDAEVIFRLRPGECCCLASTETPRGLGGDAYRRARAQAAWAVAAINHVLANEEIGRFDWRQLAQRAAADPHGFLASLAHLEARRAEADLLQALREAGEATRYAGVVRWDVLQARRVTLVPPRHWLLLEDTAPFRATLRCADRAQHTRSVAVDHGHVACFAPGPFVGDAELAIERYATTEPRVEATLRFLSAEPDLAPLTLSRLNGLSAVEASRAPGLVLLTNGLGGMARLQVDLGETLSKYDCALGANLHPSVPVDRHVFVKRIRLWAVVDGFIAPLKWDSLVSFTPGPPAVWRFVASGGDGRAVEIELTADMLPGRNTTLLRFSRPARAPVFGRSLAPDRHVSLTVRVDVEDRSFHSETHRNAGAEHHFSTHCRSLTRRIGFEFTPASDRHLRVHCDAGAYHPQAEWCAGIAHPVEASRGQTASADAYSPGWFELPMPEGGGVTLTLTADAEDPLPSEAEQFAVMRQAANEAALARTGLAEDDTLGRRLALAVQAFVVRRGEGKTVIAGYPWFLDWGRDSLICARGLLAAGLTEEVEQLLLTFARFEQAGTLPNAIYGDDASNRDTCDAPLWFGLACEELAAGEGRADAGAAPFYQQPVGRGERTIADVLRSIAAHYARGTPNGIRMDAESGLIWCPSHFTWMDTNYPACTPREGYPVEIQVLWIRLLRQLARLGLSGADQDWSQLAARAEASFRRNFWLEAQGYCADLLIARPGETARHATVDQAVRSNALFALSLGLIEGEQARRAVAVAARHLVVPGALRSLAPLPVSPPLPIRAASGHLLNQPDQPYWGRYEGDEDTRRKPAYHNGTAWTWTFPAFCEALAMAWAFAPEAVAAARAYLGSIDQLLIHGCRGHLPEIVDGDAPHTQRGCDAQAWGATEALRVWKRLQTS